MIRFTKFIAIAAIAASSGTIASAQSATSATKPFSLGLSGGASIPVGDLSDRVNTGYSLNGHVGIAAPTWPISFRGDVGYNSWGAKDNTIDVNDANIHAWSFTGNAVYSVPVQSMVRPYLIGGIGAYKTGVSSGNTSFNDDTRFGYNLGGGITLPLTGFNTFVEARYNHVNTDGGSFAYVPITFGIMF